MADIDVCKAIKTFSRTSKTKKVNVKQRKETSTVKIMTKQKKNKDH